MDNRDMNIGKDGNATAQDVLRIMPIKDNTGADKYFKSNKGPKENTVSVNETGFKK